MDSNMEDTEDQQNPSPTPPTPPTNGQDPPPSKSQPELSPASGQENPDEPMTSTESGAQGYEQGGDWFPSSTGSSDSTKSGSGSGPTKSATKDNDPDSEEYGPPLVSIPVPRATEGDGTVGWTSLWEKLYINRYGKKSHATYRVEKDCVDDYEKPDEENINNLLNHRGHLRVNENSTERKYTRRHINRILAVAWQGHIATTADDEYDRSEDLDLIDPAVELDKSSCADNAKAAWPVQGWLLSIIAASKKTGYWPAQVQPVDWIPVDALAKGIATIAVSHHAEDDALKVYNMVHPDPAPWDLLLSTLQDRFSIRATPISLPCWLDHLDSKTTKLYGFLRAAGQGREHDMTFDVENASTVLPKLPKITVDMLEIWLSSWGLLSDDKSKL